MANKPMFFPAAARRRILARVAAMPPVTIEVLNAIAIASKRRSGELPPHDPVTILGEHHGPCGGQVHFRSWYEDVGQSSELVGGGFIHRWEEQRSCACRKCGCQITDPDHLALYIEQVNARRSKQ